MSRIEPPMSPYESLCYFDPRNPNGNPLPDDDDPRQPRELGCACDNCFYGRDKLAMEIIQLRENLTSAVDVASKAGEERDRFRTALEHIRANLSVTAVPSDEWVKALHGSLFTIAHFAINPKS